MGIVGWYLCGVNMVAFAVYGFDKARARSGGWRVSEMCLLVLAAIGGALGAYVAMRCFRHKTRKWRFAVLVPALAVVYTVVVLGVIFQGVLW